MTDANQRGRIKDAAPADEFRSITKEFLRVSLPVELATRVRGGHELSKEEVMGWHRIVHAQGWAAPAWPKEWGGTGWTGLQRYVFDEECHRAGAPPLIAMGLVVVAPILIQAGSEQQRRRFLPPILEGSEIWCQGFSEPNSGSDLASLRCRAEADGDGYVVNGSKIWTTLAHWADWCLVLVRTADSKKKQEGISILLIPMNAAGVTVRPIRTIDGLHVVNEVFFENVRVPNSAMVGAPGQGWALLKHNIGHERILNANIGLSKAVFERICSAAAATRREGAPLLVSSRFQDRLAQLEIRLRALDAMAVGILRTSDGPSNAQASILKIRGTEVQQELARLQSDMFGYQSLPFHRDTVPTGWLNEMEVPELAVTATATYLFLRKASISSGTNEIQREIVGRALLRGEL